MSTNQIIVPNLETQGCTDGSTGSRNYLSLHNPFCTWAESSASLLPLISCKYVASTLRKLLPYV